MNIKFSFFYVLSAWMCAVLLISCGGDDEPGAKVTGELSLQGVWRFCNRFENTSSQFTYRFIGIKFFSEKADFLNNSCSGGPANGTDLLHSGTYVIGTQTNSGTEIGAVTIDFKIDNAFGIPVAPYFFYQIYGIDGTTLYLGDNRSSKDGFHPINRPNELLLSQDYIYDVAATNGNGPGVGESTYTGSLANNYSASNVSLTIANCQSASDNGSLTIDSAILFMLDGTDANYNGVIQLSDSSGIDNLTSDFEFTGSINNAMLTGSFSSVFARNGTPEKTGNGTFSGTLNGNNLSISFEEQDQTGDTCLTTGAIDFTVTVN